MAPADGAEHPAAGTCGASVPPLLTVHVVGRPTESVGGYLVPLMQLLSERGRPQHLLYADTQARRRSEVEPHQTQAGEVTGQAPARVDHLWPVPLGVRVQRLATGSSPWQHARALSIALRVLRSQQRIETLYLHGLVPGMAWCLLPVPVAGKEPQRILLSPHGSRHLSRLPLRRLAALAFIRHRLRSQPHAAVVTMALEARWFKGFSDDPVHVVECPVDPCFFDAQPRPARRPLLLSASASGNPRTLALYSRLAVLLLDERLGLSFNWIGPIPAAQQRACKSAGVAGFEDHSPAARAQRLATCWVFVALCDDGGYPLRLAEAMAAGVACVALETDVTRSLLTDGEDGFLCVDVPSLLARIALLVDSDELRSSLGARARETAQRRLSSAAFRRRVDWAWRVEPDVEEPPAPAAPAQLTALSPQEEA